jgi:Uma2 family endonuclease
MVTQQPRAHRTAARPTLENGDHMDADEFHRRYSLRPDIHKAELIGGIVYIPSEYTPRAGEPGLDNGDHMSPEEFHRRYSLRPDIKKAELINGVVYVASPVRLLQHGEPHALLMGEFASYKRTRKGIRLGDNATVRLPSGIQLQPDCLLALSPRLGGRTSLNEDGYMVGVPELCAEVAASSVSYDLHLKKEIYRAAGVQEYLVWRVEDEAIDWWRLEGGQYVPLTPDASGAIHSQVFEGLVINIPALLEAARDADAG